MPLTDNELIERIGMGLFQHDKWAHPLARSLGVTNRTFRRWRRDTYMMPAEIWDELKAKCLEAGLLDLIPEIDRRIAETRT